MIDNASVNARVDFPEVPGATGDARLKHVASDKDANITAKFSPIFRSRTQICGYSAGRRAIGDAVRSDKRVDDHQPDFVGLDRGNCGVDDRAGDACANLRLLGDDDFCFATGVDE
jgi:hypothetical protein